MKEYAKTAKEMLEFIEESPTCFQAVASLKKLLKKEGFSELKETEDWKSLEKGGKYYVVRNSSSIIAFHIPTQEKCEGKYRGFHMAAAHSDSPTFKVKENAEMKVEEKYIRLNTEKYGGMILSTWLDRPLSVAGRIVVKGKKGLEEKLVNVDKDLCVIPNLAIHMNREMNKGVEYNPQVDMLPLFGQPKEEEKTEGMLLKEVAEAAGMICSCMSGIREGFLAVTENLYCLPDWMISRVLFLL